MSDCDYSAIEVPEDKDPSEYSYHQRRADLLDRILEAGTPDAINQSELAREVYDCDQSTISNDVSKLGDYIGDHIGSEAYLETKAVYSKAITGLIEEGDAGEWRAYKAAADVIDKRNQWLGDIGVQHREPQRSEVELEADHKGGANGGYRIVEDPEAVLEGEDDDTLSDEAEGAEGDLGFSEAPAAPSSAISSR